ncbi:STAS domain-containing protein [Catellatospora paridis]|uniref:STAS domain-containing protein n=1 Tax=Catellatospora paridis TaxID=1617086 RepID=UPI001E4FDF0E|nr:STAS domain-containing protein [Catellatospora paridis]
MEVTDVDVHGDDPREAVVAVSGEIDLTARDDLLNTLYSAIHTAGVTRVVVDLAQVSFMDSTGLHVLITARERALGSGVAFHVVGATGIVRRVLAVTGLLKLLAGDMDADPDKPAPPPATDPSHATSLPSATRS